MKGPLNVDNPIISKLDGHKAWAIIFVKLIQGLKIRILEGEFSTMVCKWDWDSRGWMIIGISVCPKLLERNIEYKKLQ